MPLAGADNLKMPFTSVTAPAAVPLTLTLTPGKALPSSDEVTFPVICRFCAKAPEQINIVNKKISIDPLQLLNLVISTFLVILIHLGLNFLVDFV